MMYDRYLAYLVATIVCIAFFIVVIADVFTPYEINAAWFPLMGAVVGGVLGVRFLHGKDGNKDE